MRQILEAFKKFFREFENLWETLIKFNKYIKILKNFLREFREILEKMNLYLEKFRKQEIYFENLSNSFNNFVNFKKN